MCVAGMDDGGLGVWVKSGPHRETRPSARQRKLYSSVCFESFMAYALDRRDI